MDVDANTLLVATEARGCSVVSAICARETSSAAVSIALWLHQVSSFKFQVGQGANLIAP